MADAIVSGIYKIENTVAGKFYIGSAVCFNRRWNQHKSELSKGMHCNPKMSAAEKEEL